MSRFHGDGLRSPFRRATFQKRSEEGPHVQDFNSVPFMGIYINYYIEFCQFDSLGKRSEESGDAGVRSGGIMVRRPR